MSNTSNISNILSNHSSKLNSLLDQLENKLADTISQMTPEQKIELYERLSKQYGIKLEILKDRV